MGSREEVKMYSPKIKADLIPDIYWAAKALGIRMTTLVNRILERVFNEVKVLGGEAAISDGTELVFQEELERALNGLREEIRSSMASEGKEATIIGEFKISVSKTAKLKCRFLTTDPKRPGSIVYPMIDTRRTTNGGDDIERKEVTATGEEFSLPEENVGEFS
jgi:hypothetical protein